MTLVSNTVPLASGVLPEASCVLPEARRVLPQASRAVPEAWRAVPEAWRAVPEASSVVPKASRRVAEARRTTPRAPTRACSIGRNQERATPCSRIARVASLAEGCTLWCRVGAGILRLPALPHPQHRGFRMYRLMVKRGSGVVRALPLRCASFTDVDVLHRQEVQQSHDLQSTVVDGA